MVTHIVFSFYTMLSLLASFPTTVHMLTEEENLSLYIKRHKFSFILLCVFIPITMAFIIFVSLVCNIVFKILEFIKKMNKKMCKENKNEEHKPNQV